MDSPRCPYCSRPVIYDSELLALVCPACGMVLDSNPIDAYAPPVYSDKDDARWWSGGFTYRVIDKGVGSTLKTGDELEALSREKPVLYKTLKILNQKYVKLLSLDKCTVETAGKMLHEALDGVTGTVFTSKLESLVKTVLVISSRLCGHETRPELLFGRRGHHLKEMMDTLEKFPALRKYYVPGNRDQILENYLLKVLTCLENSNIVPADRAGEIFVKTKEHVELVKTRYKGRNLAGIAVALIYRVAKSMGMPTTYSNMVKCIGFSERNLETYSRLVKRILGY